MTIAACYVSPEGVVLGADSTASYAVAGGLHYFNHAQKLFEIGSSSTLGAVIWGLGTLGPASYRTLFAELGDDLEQSPATDVGDAMMRWIDRFWAVFEQAYSTEPDFAGYVAEARALDAKPAFDPATALPDPSARTQQEEARFQELKRGLTVGFCIGGRVAQDRTPAAYFVQFEPTNTTKPVATPIPVNSYRWFGVPNMIQRLVFGSDDETKHAIISSKHWSGTAGDLDNVIAPYKLDHPSMPLRDVVDFVYSCIYSTIKALKFSPRSQVCGGPIELAVISTDRPFRWIRHKTWDAAVVDGAPA